MESINSDLKTLGSEVVSRLLTRSAYNGTDSGDINTLMNPNGADGAEGTVSEEASNNSGREAYEFVAFLLWYLFLVLCCVLPTCCAYRRRRLMEARLAQQQANFDQIHQQNVFILSNLHLRQAGGAMGAGGLRLDLDSDEARAERTKRISAALKPTTFTVSEKDISMKEPIKSNSTDNGEGGVENNTNNLFGTTHVVVDEEMGGVVVPLPPQEDIDNSLLQLPSEAANGSRVVPGGCAICLCPYEDGDQVSWSKEEACQHAFHQECIIPWLAKKEEPKCPCCRQDFCVVEPLTPSDLATLAAGSLAGAHHHHHHHHHLHHHTAAAAAAMSPFGLIPTSFLSLEPSTAAPSPDLTASQIVTEEGVVSISPLVGQPSISGQGTNGTTDAVYVASSPQLPVQSASVAITNENEVDELENNDETSNSRDMDENNNIAVATDTASASDMDPAGYETNGLDHDGIRLNDDSNLSTDLRVTGNAVTPIITTHTTAMETLESTTGSQLDASEECSDNNEC